ncbi:hypothetical protein AC579_3250 [Pseudocercospora musae]|uniref:F-box domain-containing protein n=1 Tax=Pseudocercospora musae TaxID=113226 RepID=A0A139HZZ9_9PEZI|nr:hypothetical protein AC579_3250 [Pseudocercospora musae]
MERSLRELVASLPQEIYEQIYNDVFSLLSPLHLEIYINKSWRPPSILQVNRAIRAEFLHAYYSNHIFVARRRDTYWFGLLCDWIDARKHLWHKAPGGFGIPVRLGDIGPYMVMGDGRIFS